MTINQVGFSRKKIQWSARKFDFATLRVLRRTTGFFNAFLSADITRCRLEKKPSEVNIQFELVIWQRMAFVILSRGGQLIW